MFINVIHNACAAIRIKQDSGLAPAPGQVAIRMFSANAGLLIEFTDNGCDISPDNLGRIFEPFFTAKPVGEGTGLGLTIAFGILGNHGGHITVTSVKDQGSAFARHLPLPEPAPD